MKFKILKQFAEIRDRINNVPYLPKNMTASEKMIVEITKNIILDPDTELEYDPDTYECYIVNGHFYIFIEARVVKVINSVFGYDVHISSQVEMYLTNEFKKEKSRRIKHFKNNVESKVDNSLSLILDEIRNKKSNLK
jgi:hypothetical protein